MIIGGEKFKVINIFESVTTVPDCFVVSSNKIGVGHGEAKFYFNSREKTQEFFGGVGFRAKCFILRQDLLTYLYAIKDEYLNPSQEYRGKDNMSQLWEEHIQKVLKMNEVEMFTVIDQPHLAGVRGYVNASKADSYGYQLIREVSLPLISFIQVMELKDSMNSSIFYWKLFVDFEAINEHKSVGLVLNYGKNIDVLPNAKESKRDRESQLSRVGQGEFRAKLLLESPFCPITRVADERLLIASHIKPWAISNNKDRIDPKNGLILSPVYDKLFDRGFITFSDDKRLIASNWINPSDLKKLNVKSNSYHALLPLDDQRELFMKYHREYVFKG